MPEVQTPPSPKAPGKTAAHRPAGKPAPKKKRKPMSEKDKEGAGILSVILVLGFAAYLVIVLIIAMLVWYSFSGTANRRTSYSIRVLDETDTRLFTYDAPDANRQYGLYLRFSDLSRYCDLGVAGDEEKVTFFLPGDEDEVVCYRNSSLVQINGNTARIGAPILFEKKDYLIPLSLFEDYLGGFGITYDEDKLLCTVVIPKEPVFTPRMHASVPMAPCESLPFADDSSAAESSEN